MTIPLDSRPFLLAAAAFAGLVAQTPVSGASAQSKLEARYTASLAGIELGRGAWVIEIGQDYFTAAASGATTGLARVFTSGEGTGASRGYFTDHQFSPASYAASMTAGKKTEEVRITLAGGNVKEFDISPPSPPIPDRIPLSDAHRRGVLDPMTASLVPVPGKGELLSPDVCQRRLSIFDGRLRYDLSFAFKRIEMVKAQKGYAGPVLVCAVYFKPVAGHVPDRPAMKYLAAQQEMEVWLAPLNGARVLVPYRFSVPTPLGQGVLQATSFEAAPWSAKASATTQ